MTSSATEIRTAAEKLRALATAAAHEDRTRWMTGHTLGSKSPVVVDDHTRPTVLIETWAKHREQVDAYLAAFGSPAVGLAVARLLEQASKEIAECGGFAAGAVDGPLGDRDHNTWSAALAVAREITGAGLPPAEHPMARALRLGAATIPDALVAEITEATNSGIPPAWTEYTDADSDVWHLTDEIHAGDRVMLPSACDMAPMLRRDVQRFFGPLTTTTTERGK